jgi:hypothetical protein
MGIGLAIEHTSLVYLYAAQGGLNRLDAAGKVFTDMSVIIFRQ